MGILIAIIIGGLAGWLASIILNRNENQGVIGNIIVGVIGAFIANLLVAPLFGTHIQLSSPTWGTFALDVVGSIILLALVNLFTRRSVR